jgi:leader peptidase (prepilin peptidase)/N-methyltransferase
MELTDLTRLPNGLWLGLAALLGLVLGSFAGVVVYRLPRQLLGEEGLGLCFPASHCAACQQPLRWWHNLPVFSYAWLRGRCGFCGAPIGVANLWLELVFAALWVGCVLHLGPGRDAVVWGAFFSVLVVLCFIDAQTMLLPDLLTLPLALAGGLLALAGWTGVEPLSALLGAGLGWGMLASVAWVFERWRGVAGMGGGDPKLMAALGAWLGFPALLPMALIASVLHLAYALVLTGGRRQQEVPFGPAMAAAAAFYWIFRDQAWMSWLTGGLSGPLG